MIVLRPTLRILLIAIGIAFLGSCGDKSGDNSKNELTQRQRDSVLVETGLPGAKTVGRASAAADSAAARARHLDDLAK